MCNEIIVMMRYSTYRRSGTLQLYCTVPLAFPYATQFDRTIHTSVAVTLQSVRKYLLLMRSSSVVAVVYCCGFQHYKVYNEVSSGYYFPNGGLSVKDPYSREVSMGSCSNNTVSFTSHVTSKIGVCPTSNCFESNMPGADELLRTQSLSAALL